MSTGYSRKPKQGAADRDVSLLHKGKQLFLRISKSYSLSRQEQRAMSFVNEPCCFDDGVCIRIGHGDEASLHGNACRLVLHLPHLGITCKIEHDRPGTSAASNVESARHSPCYVFGPTYLIAPFADRLRDADKVDFLKGIRTQEGSSHLPCYDNDRGAVEHSIADAGNRIRSSRSTCDNAHSHFTRHTCITLRSVCCTLLVTHKDLLEIVLVIEHGIKHGHDASSGIAEHCLHSLVNQ